MISLQSGRTAVPSVSADPGISSIYLLENWNGNASEGGLLRLSVINGEPGKESLTTIAYPGTPEKWADLPSTGFLGPFAPQKSSDDRIAMIDSRISNLVLRKGALWAAQTIYLPVAAPDHAAVQWWQISSEGNVLQRGRLEEEGGSFGFPSIAVNRNNEVLLGCSRFSPDIFPEAVYAYRAPDDPEGALRASASLRRGEAPFVWYSGYMLRWGDYSTSVVDPIDDRGLWTIQEYSISPPAEISEPGEPSGARSTRMRLSGAPRPM